MACKLHCLGITDFTREADDWNNGCRPDEPILQSLCNGLATWEGLATPMV